MWFLPRTEGAAPIRSKPESFIQAFARRTEAGLLPRASSRRSRYSLTRQGPDRLTFRATDWLTAVNVGLNDVELSASTGKARYTIEYRRWAAYVVLLCAAIGLAIGVFAELYKARMIPGLTEGQTAVIGRWMIFFWGFVWPWILIGLHKRPLRMLMDRIIAEVDQSARTLSARQPSS
jgi:hypothetical protein